MNVYLSGAVTTGVALSMTRTQVMDAFAAAKRACEAKWPGCYVFSPVQRISPEATHEEAMRTCLHALTVSANGQRPAYPVLVSLPGWDTSEGASLERAVAKACGIEAWDLHDVEGAL